MLLLIRAGNSIKPQCFAILHSTMLLLIPHAAPHTRQPFNFTFHYASTYTDTVKYIGVACFILHSTMLLLILYVTYKLLISVFLLHSTMLLLIRCVTYIWKRNCTILHSTMLLLIRGRDSTGSRKGCFTFHYASTYTFAGSGIMYR